MINIIRQANSNPAVFAVLFVLILLLSTSWSQSAVLTLSTIITLTWIESWTKGRESFLFSCQETNILFFYCLAREETEVVQLAFSLSLPIFSAFSPFPPILHPSSPSFTLPLFSVTAHIWFWVKARLVSSGMEGFYFSMAPLPLQFHSVVKSMQFVYELVFLSLYWFYSILIFITREPHNHP